MNELVKCQAFTQKKSSSSYDVQLILNRPKALNALSIDMFYDLIKYLKMSVENEKVQSIHLCSSSEKAFCAGGDVKSIALKNKDGDFEFADEYFYEEYSTDLMIHHYSKPIIGWANGITMGGGIGLLKGCDIQIVSEDCKLAMPEMAIGFFPDVGGGYFLNKLPHGIGWVLGLSGVHFTAEQALSWGFVDFLIKYDSWQKLQSNLYQVNESNKLSYLDKAKDILNSSYNTHSNFNVHLDEDICRLGERLLMAESFDQVVDEFKIAIGKSEFLTQAKEKFLSGSSLVGEVIWSHLKRCRGKSLNEVFLLEYSLAVNLTKQFEFQEGVRSVLIDKDYQPNWKYPLSKIENIKPEKNDIEEILKINSKRKKLC